MQEPRKILQKLGLSGSEVDVYLALTSGATRASDIVKTSGLKRPTVYYALGCLERRGLVSKTGLVGDKGFRLESANRLATIAEEIKEEAATTAVLAQAFAATLVSQKAFERPSVAFFEGKDAVKNIVMETLYCRAKSIDIVAPQKNFFWDIGRDFVERYVTLRSGRKIRTRNLWEKPVDPAVLKKYYADLSEVRILPPVMHETFSTTTFLFDDKTLYISSLKNGYCILIASQEHHDTMQAWFNGLWTHAKPQSM
ncbi:MAG: hypothetical protein A3C93_02570 [Candidatus Lloydbacteria bacterium RIFCSPHIGHO2_02_FULL_54_17]|uniref:Transcription regulator TrmB N-terminal domain-containing protein n=1 Tax=Candidatus Lloydbacteria bacterium RIFCSPHIGHO2_02_FULL_54_17 TaxID=1798664 RepID=A0A1G2DE28_9BACT|nr:MAG: hypothetical protein A2762_04330 [Candidatus Lloydbacteria bacterium RIFCSPHIGHO2_01_FULL_54_11]OGZ11793.1 MAG: hypothetical protein A3C93_02570 [Candidatus Lloydbacteria bacterium RIFCSPHIGHO2_02_FULL_54_17]OGZ14322.1 MAG: hypothetical protein A2948_01905 [Candidatus Lloydbacteria bacterium RIFCSPLOWO2_01_FULL_54_18]OGZ16010.1 MAG: hypothetical protein A3H76_00575 [Candidatus Lloydbacteria bacterium RIFCSPLOWO2_02_FULL_54_12]